MDQESNASKIYWTKDYKKFKFIHGNRDLLPIKLKRLMEDIKEGLNLLPYCPILVNKEYGIIDGQHRFYVAKKMGLNIYYVIVPDVTLSQIARLNNNQNRWKTQDFMNCFIDAGDNSQHYEILYEFVRQYKVSISLAVSMLYNGVPHEAGHAIAIFRDGSFKVRYYDEAEHLMIKSNDYQEFTDKTNTRAFLSALQKLLNNGIYDHDAVISKLKKHEMKIDHKGNAKEYMQQIEMLYNYKNQIRKPIY